MTPRAACRLVEADYLDHDVVDDHIRIDTLDIDGCQASIWTDGTHCSLVTRGSNDGWDWARNFQFVPGWSMMGASGAAYHRGVLQSARMIFAWLKNAKRPITFSTGHSLGGGVGQIVGPSIGVPTITFAAPKVLARGSPPRADLVTNYVLPGDPVPWLVPGYRHVGKVVSLKPTSGWWGARHANRHYLEALI